MSDDFEDKPDLRYVYTSCKDDSVQRELSRRFDAALHNEPVHEVLLSLAVVASHLAAIHDHAAEAYVGIEVLTELFQVSCQMLLMRRLEVAQAINDPRRCPDCGQLHEQAPATTPFLKGGE